MSRILKARTSWKQYALSLLASLSFFLSIAQNPIITENALPGNPASEWDITGAGDPSLQGFATDISINKGQTVYFKIKTDASDYTIDIYRIGYYNGDGARKTGTGTITATLPQTQPDPFTDEVSGLVDCGNWDVSAHWDVPSTAVSGIYIALLRRPDNNGSSHIVFIVRDDASSSELFFQTSDATWQAYNVYGGNSLYVGATSFPNGHASKVSYNRPFITRDGGGGGGIAEDWLFNAEYPMIRFLERNGYDVTYTTNVDAARHGSLLLNHKIFLSVGHDEYWSAEQRASVEAARNAGVHLAFFSGNEMYWKTRWENSADGSDTPYRTLVCYKEGTLGENVCGTKCDPSTEWTGLWRDGCSYPSGGACKPENALTNQIGWQSSTGAIEVPSEYKDFRFWRNTHISSLTQGEVAIFPDGTLGYEWDHEQEQYAGTYPHGRIILSNTDLNGANHKLSLYRHSNGALVFGAGTIQWSWGLDDIHDRGHQPVSRDMQQATVNLFADMGAQPGTLQSDLVEATQSDDATPPVVTISYPGHGSTFTAFLPVTIRGTAADAGAVAGVEISFDGGATWKLASGTNNWTYTWTPSAIGTVSIKVRAFDDSGNMSTPGSAPSSDAIIIASSEPLCPCTIFQPTVDTPAYTNQYSGIDGVELGVKFRAKMNGYIRGVRFYKSTNDVGVHTGTLWDLNGNMITTAVFSNETGSGWQEVLFDEPVAITANTTYVASYFSPTGYYADTNPFFTDSVSNGPLTAISTFDADGPNGVYTFSPESVFPSSTYDSDNYFVDVIFHTAATDQLAPVVTSTSPTDYAIGIDINAAFKTTFNESLNPSSVVGSTLELKDALNNLVPTTLTYNAGTYTATLTPLSVLNYSSTYKVVVKAGATGVKDISGNALAQETIKTFSTKDASTLSFNDGPGGPILVISSPSNPFSRYAAEILRAEGLNEFAILDFSSVNATILGNYDVVILGEMTVTSLQATMLTNWVNGGGTLVAFRPGSTLNSLMGISATAGTISNKYLLVNTASAPGEGIVGETMQFHGDADLHTLNGATAVATLYSDAATATPNPAVTMINVGSNGGKAIAFTFDLARSIVYTRQGNPAWAGQERDGQSPIRSNDLFFGIPANNEPNWVDFNKIAIPQADEQQRLLANIILESNLHRKPLPRFWYLPRDLKAAIVMTGDDHAVNGTTDRFNHYLNLGPNTPADVANWNAVRGTSYLYPGTPITNAQAVAFQNQGFEIALHPSTSCTNFTEASLTSTFTSELALFTGAFPGISSPVSNRTHCMVWSDWATHAKVEASKGMRLDANYYYWPGSWIQNRPGMFTGSGMPMRFADLDGTMIDCYQVPTQMTDESGITVGNFCDALLDKALGTEGYYGVFNANMHTDTGATHTGSNAIINSALARQVPVVSAKQMLTWLDGRNNSSFTAIAWNGNVLSFTITAASGSANLRAMVPANSGSNSLSEIRRAGSIIPFTLSTIKGIQYAFFDAHITGNYTATYGSVSTTTITGQVTLEGRPAAPDGTWVVPVQVEIYITGNPTPVSTFNTTTNSNGQFSISGVPIGTFNIRVKNVHTLAVMRLDEALVAGGNNLNFGLLREGDANNDNSVDLLDFSILLATYNKFIGEQDYDSRTDYNGDDGVDLLDFSLLLLNYNAYGEENP